MRGPYTSSTLSEFFCSSRRRHTIYWRDWSSDVCSSDLCSRARTRTRSAALTASSTEAFAFRLLKLSVAATAKRTSSRSEERRVGKTVDVGGGGTCRKKERQDGQTARAEEHRMYAVVVTRAVRS